MNLLTQCTYSIFGRYNNIGQKSSKIAELFPNFLKNIIQQQTMSGETINVYQITDNENKMIINLKNDRIDFIYPDGKNENIEKFETIYNNLLVILENPEINRLAINCTFVYEGFEMSNFNDNLKNKIGIIHNFGKVKEINVRENFEEKILDKDFNDVIIIQNGKMQNPTTFESVESLMFLIDINNVPIENTEDKYLSKDNYKEFFIEMQKILDSKREYIFELMEGNSNV